MEDPAHLVQAHLGITAENYDAAIRRFVPHYEEMLAMTVETVAAAMRADSAGLEIVELGVGTGALTGALATRLPEAHFLGIDCDPQMLARAQVRLACRGSRVRFVQARFAEGLPVAGCQVVVASLALHHERVLPGKIALYRRIHAALRPGGIFVNADVTLASAGRPRALALDAWIAHQVASGIPEPEARQQLQNWQRDEDRYFTTAEELDALAQAGFPAVDVVWRRGPMSVLLAARLP